MGELPSEHFYVDFQIRNLLRRTRVAAPDADNVVRFDSSRCMPAMVMPEERALATFLAARCSPREAQSIARRVALRGSSAHFLLPTQHSRNRLALVQATHTTSLSCDSIDFAIGEAAAQATWVGATWVRATQRAGSGARARALSPGASPSNHRCARARMKQKRAA